MSLKAEASKLYLSYLWWVIEPVLFVLLFYFVFETLLNVGRENYLFFLICGKIPYLWFSKSVLQASNSIVAGHGLINKLPMTKLLFPYVSLHESLRKQWVVFVVLFFVAFWYGQIPSILWLWLIPLIAVQYLLILGCGLIGALMVTYIADMRMVISLGLTCLMFASGIFWDVQSISDVQTRELILTYNPLAFLIDAYRGVLMSGSMYSLYHLTVLFSVLLVLLFIVHMVYFRLDKAIAARVLNS